MSNLRCDGCGLSQRTIEHRKGWWECSRLDCPSRRSLTAGCAETPVVWFEKQSPHLAEESNDADGQ